MEGWVVLCLFALFCCCYRATTATITIPGEELLFSTVDLKKLIPVLQSTVKLTHNNNRTWAHPHFPADLFLLSDQISALTPQTQQQQEEVTYSPAPMAASKVKDITGPGITTQFQFEGTDLGEPFMFQNGAFGFFFGDTFNEYKAGGTGWRSPVMCRSHTYPLDGGITWDNCAGTGSASSGKAKQILPNAQYGYNKYGQYEVTVIPGDGITVGEVNYLSFMSVHSWSDPNWATNYAGLATSNNYGEDWTVQSPVWFNDGNGDMHQMWTMCNGNDGYIYIISCAFGRVRTEGMILQKVPEKQLLTQSAYIPWGWTQANGWKWGQPATPILPGPLGELSLRLIEKTWVLSYFSPSRYAIVMRTAAKIDGLWSNEIVVLRGAEVPQLYGGFIHSLSTLNNIHFIVSQWITSTNTPYHAMQYKTSISTTTVEENYKINSNVDDENYSGFTDYYPYRVYTQENLLFAQQQEQQGYFTIRQTPGSVVESQIITSLATNLPASCSSEEDMQQYVEFVKNVGTHYVSSVTMKKDRTTGTFFVATAEHSPITLLCGENANRECISKAIDKYTQPL